MASLDKVSGLWTTYFRVGPFVQFLSRWETRAACGPFFTRVIKCFGVGGPLVFICCSDWESFIKGLSYDQLWVGELVRGNRLPLLEKRIWLLAASPDLVSRSKALAWLVVKLEEQLPSSLSAFLFPLSLPPWQQPAGSLPFPRQLLNSVCTALCLVLVLPGCSLNSASCSPRSLRADSATVAWLGCLPFFTTWCFYLTHGLINIPFVSSTVQVLYSKQHFCCLFSFALSFTKVHLASLISLARALRSDLAWGMHSSQSCREALSVGAITGWES